MGIVARDATKFFWRGLKALAVSHLLYMAYRSKASFSALPIIAGENNKNIFDSIARTEIKKIASKARYDLFGLEMALIADIRFSRLGEMFRIADGVDSLYWFGLRFIGRFRSS
jgi:hypothetical protein